MLPLSISGLQRCLDESRNVQSAFLTSPVILQLGYPGLPIKLKSASWKDDG